MQTKSLVTIAAVLLAAGITGCSSDDDNDSSAPTVPTPTETLQVPQTYSFESRFGAGSSVAYSGQTARQALIDGVNSQIGSGLDAMIGSGQLNAATTRDDVIAILNSYFAGGTDALSSEQVSLSTNPAPLQATYGAISSGKDLKSKFAGNDAVTDHKDWDNGGFVGWSQAQSPEALIQTWFGQIADNTVEQANGTQRLDPINGGPIKLYLTEDGLDLKQLVQKFLIGAVAFSQGADDYLDDDIAGKGLLADNTAADGTKPYTPLEHQWDEGFGYFGAARDYNNYSDSEIAGKSGRDGYNNGYHDSNADSAIDLESEFNFGASTNAAKRDLGSSTGTDFTKATFDAFLTGRAIITSANGALSEQQLNALKAQRDIVVTNWEKAIAATVVHYINDVIDDMATFGTPQYSYADHAKHWAELKGFALGLQFNPRSPLTDTAFADFHGKVGDRPVLPNAPSNEIELYETALLEARAILQEGYGFAQADVENW